MEEYPILAIDYGEKNFGLAISDSKGIMATPLDTVSITKKRDINFVIQDILRLCEEYNVKGILVGKPQVFSENQEKTEKKISKFISLLKNSTNIPLNTYDESFSTTEAQNVLTSSGQNYKSYKNKIDSVAATVFLQEFLNSKNKKNE
jgi:putative Holliday junction resolvase